MNRLNSILIFMAVLVTVYLQDTCDLTRHWLGAQIDLLPALMIYASLRCEMVTVAALAVFGGLCLDSLSANPLGASILPLFFIGFIVHPRRGLLLREVYYARFVLGLCASGLTPLLTLLFILSKGRTPVLGWGTIWQWLVMTLGGGLLTPVVFWLFDWLNRALTYQPVFQNSFRPDREIRRGRN
jgi:hypothetical protein